MTPSGQSLATWSDPYTQTRDMQRDTDLVGAAGPACTSPVLIGPIGGATTFPTSSKENSGAVLMFVDVFLKILNRHN